MCDIDDNCIIVIKHHAKVVQRTQPMPEKVAVSMAASLNTQTPNESIHIYKITIGTYDLHFMEIKWGTQQ
jgi:hypothetical protein